MPILPSLPRPERRRMHKIIQTTRDKQHARRVMAILLRYEGCTLKKIHKLTGAARSTLGRWLNWYHEGGLEALRSQRPGRPPSLPIRHIIRVLQVLIQFSPQDLGYQRSRWSTELFAIEINRLLGLNIAASTLRRWLPREGIVWRRVAPTLRIKDPDYDIKVEQVKQALAGCCQDNPVLYADEVDIDLNPKLGADWTLRGQQKKVVTPGINEKHYLAGALHAATGQVTYVAGYKKNSALFISLLEVLRRRYRRARNITLILDNYVIHKSRVVQSWLADNPKYILVFQPVYSPWINKIELLWHKLHETVTRNHQCHSMVSLLKRVRHFMDTVSPFPGSGYGITRM